MKILIGDLSDNVEACYFNPDIVKSYDNTITKGLRLSMQAYANASGDAFVTGERLAKAQEGLTEQLGIAVDFGNEERETFARLTELTGLTADEAGNLAKFSAATGKSTKSYVSDLRVAANEAINV